MTGRSAWTGEPYSKEIVVHAPWSFSVGLALATVLSALLSASSAQAAAFDPASMRNRAAALLDTGEDERAIGIFRDLVKRLPTSVTDHVNLGIALLTHNDLPGAEAELRKALETQPKDLRALYNLGILLKRRGKNDEAAQTLAVVSLSPEGKKDASVQYNLGIVYKRLRRGEEALRALRAATSLRPEHASAHFQIYNELIQRGDKAEAAKELELFKLLQKATPDFQRMEAYLERGRFTEIAAPGPRLAGSEGSEGANPPSGPSGLDEANAGITAEPAWIRFERKAAKPGSSSEGSAPKALPDGGLRAGALADFDGNGKLDLASPALGGKLSIFPGAGAGSPPPSSAALDLPPQADQGLALAAGDLDNDGDFDLFVSAAGGAKLYLNDGKGRFTDAAKGSGLEAATGATRAVFVDVDRDGDLDLVLGGTGAGRPGPRLFLSASIDSSAGGSKGAAEGSGAKGGPPAAKAKAAPRPPRFLPAGEEAHLPPRGAALAFSDLGGRDDPDLAFASRDGTISIARNLRAGRFVSSPVTAGPSTSGGAGSEGGARADDASGGRAGGSESVTREDVEIRMGDLDGDARNDAVVLAGGGLVASWNDGEGTLGLPGPLAPGQPAACSGLVLLDADGDGDVDVVTTASAKLVVYRNEGARKFTQLTDAAPALPAGAATLFAGDLDGDGAPDLVLLAPAEERPIALLNRTKSANRFLKVDLTGTKSNRTAVGAKVQVSAGRLVVTREYDGTPLSIGIGPRGRADAVRVVWPTGVTQDVIDAASGPCRLEEKREFAGSCPFLYAWDGDRFRFIGEALSGAPIGFLRPDGTIERPHPVEHLRLPPGLPAPRTDGPGRLSLRMTEEMREMTALDRVRLVAVDHPAELEVYSNERLTEADPEPFQFLAIESLEAPSAAAEVRLGQLRQREAAGARTPGTERIHSNERGTYAAGHTGPATPGAERARVGVGNVEGSKGDETFVPKEHEAADADRGLVNRLSRLDGLAAERFETLGPRLEGLAEPHALVLEFGSGGGGEHSGRAAQESSSLAVARNAGKDRSDAGDRKEGSSGGSALKGGAVGGAVERGAEQQTARLALVLDGWVSWTTSDVSRALLQARLARGEGGDRHEVRPVNRELAAEPGETAGVPAGTGPHASRTVQKDAASEPSGRGSVPTDELSPADGGPSEQSEFRSIRRGSDSRPSFAGVMLPETPEPWGPALEVRTTGDLAFEPDLGLPIGPTMVAPLPGDIQGGPLEVRIGSNLAVYYDRIRLGRVVEAPLTVRELAPVAAELRWRGVAASRRSADAEPPLPDYDDLSPGGPFPRLHEETTPQGDVLPLLGEADGRFVVFGNGDEVALEFDRRGLPEPAAGFTRTWFLVSTGFARDGDPNTEPLPWGN